MAEEIVLPFDILALPAKVGKLEGDMTNVRTRIANVEGRVSAVESKVAAIRGLTAEEVEELRYVKAKRPAIDDVIAHFDVKVKKVVTPEYVRGMIDAGTVRKFVDAAYVRSLVPLEYIKPMITGTVTAGYVKGMVDEVYGNISPYHAKFPRLDEIPGLRDYIAKVEGLVPTDEEIKGLITYDFLTTRIPRLPDMDALAKIKADLEKFPGVRGKISTLKTQWDTLITDWGKLADAAVKIAKQHEEVWKAVDDIITGGPDKKFPSPWDGLTNLAKAILPLRDQWVSFGALMGVVKGDLSFIRDTIKAMP
ncbi:MAG: hypothetical protein AB1779_00835 [Candidatus Thermoplasmatota archaeon]